MLKELYKMWRKELQVVAQNDKQIDVWIKDFVRYADKIITPSKKGDTIGISSGRKHFKIIRDE